MDTVLALITWATTSGPQFVTALMAVLTATIALCMMIPGEQPEKALQSAVDFLSKFSKK